MDLLKDIPDLSVDLIIADPPYYRVMLNEWDGTKHEWDNQWDSFEDYIAWCKVWFKEIKRILKNNGSFYLFADDKNCSYLQVELDKIGLYLENHIVWVKPNNMTIKGWNRYNSYAPITERILFYSKQQRTHNLENEFYAETIVAFKPIIEYMKEQKQKVKEVMHFETDEEFNQFVNKVTGTKSVVARHYFTYSQWVFPTEELYKKLQSINNAVFQKEYAELQKEYAELLRYFRPKKNFTDVWTFNITSSQEDCIHPCQKPIALIRRIIETSSKENDLVVDLFVGSGTVPLACQQLGRRWVGSEKEAKYIPLINLRLSQKNIHHFSNTLLTQPSAEGSLISVKRESVDSPNSPHDLSTNKEEANFS